MAKKIDVTEMTVEQKLKALYQLQTTLSEIDRIRTLRGELPLEVQDLEDEIAGLETRLNKYEEEVAGLKTEIQSRNRQIAEAKENKSNREEKLNNVRNNREYDSLLKEIEYFDYDLKVQEKKIGEAEAIIAERQEQIAQAGTLIDERKEELEQKKAELDTIVSETKAEEEKLREKAKGYETQIEPRLLSAFKRIRKNSRNGLGIVYVERDACGGCFNKIPPQRQLDIRMRKKIIVCEYCGRIMIDPELAGVKPAGAATEEKPKRRRKATPKKAEA